MVSWVQHLLQFQCSGIGKILENQSPVTKKHIKMQFSNQHMTHYKVAWIKYENNVSIYLP